MQRLSVSVPIDELRESTGTAATWPSSFCRSQTIRVADISQKAEKYQGRQTPTLLWQLHADQVRPVTVEEGSVVSELRCQRDALCAPGTLPECCDRSGLLRLALTAPQ